MFTTNISQLGFGPLQSVPRPLKGLSRKCWHS